ncbi:hypothetical protein FHW83_000960 [Duganella sp. SG902]|uniref:hypothetical protein n=1 Tax=Duganella sp. SG902 TaxID=2587016 RepID=UPI00159D34C2|nr:hypothetical protein [Duganella sp. SG902]NVM75180.1 hypothetical protein [Duganella sp. SG902]
MNTPSNRTEYDAQVQQLKKKFESDGYEVIIDPQSPELPFELPDYSPDLVVKKPDGGGFIVEVKTTHTRTSAERYQSIANIVRQNHGWRFLLVTIDDLNIPAFAENIIGWDELEEKLKTTRSLIDSNHAEAAVLYLWSIFEAAMRKLAITEAMPIERLPAVKMLNQLYTVGYISVDEFSTVKTFLNMRNGITHGFGTSPDGPLLESFFRIVSALIAEWKVYSSEPSLDASC